MGEMLKTYLSVWANYQKSVEVMPPLEALNVVKELKNKIGNPIKRHNHF